MSFVNLNLELAKAMEDLERAIERRIAAEEKLDKAKMELLMAESSKKKAALEQKLYQEKKSSLEEQARNLRQEARI